jgi:Tol biopolymer transport system component
VTQVALSPDGTKLAFWSDATNLVPGTTDGRMHLYVKTLSSGAISVVDTTSGGELSNDPWSGPPLGIGWAPDSSAILFASSATNLDPVGIQGLTKPYLFVKILSTGEVEALIEMATGDVAWSPDGSKIAFGSKGDYCFPEKVTCTSTNNNDTKFYFYDFQTELFVPITANRNGVQPLQDTGPNSAADLAWSPDSTRVAFTYAGDKLGSGDTNRVSDVYVKNVNTLELSRVSLSASGKEPNSGSDSPAWSPDGKKIAFTSKATNLVPGDNNSALDVFVKTLSGGAIATVSTGEDGEFKLFDSRRPKWSPDGKKIAFMSDTIDLIPGFLDANERTDIYVRTLASNTLDIVSTDGQGTLGNSASTLWGVLGSTGGWLPDGSGMVFMSNATNLADNDNNAFNRSVFLKRGLNTPKALSGAKPTIGGTAKVGSKLTAKPGSWTSGTKVSYQWKREGKAISGATTSSYKLVAADAGKKITVTVTGAKSGYAKLAKTSSSKTVAKVAPKVKAKLAKTSVKKTAKAKLTVTAKATGFAASKLTGKVTVKDGAKKVGSGTLKKGKATITLKKITKTGTHKLTVSYAGTSQIAAKKTTITLKVTK